MRTLKITSAGERIKVAGIVSGLQVRHSKKGNRFCIFRFRRSSTGNIKCLVWSENYQKYSEFLKDDEILILDGRVESNDGTEITIIVEQIMQLADAVPQKARNLSVTLQ